MTAGTAEAKNVHAQVERSRSRRVTAAMSGVAAILPSPRAGGEKVPSASEADEGLPHPTTPVAAVETSRSPSSALRAPSPRIRGEKGFVSALERALGAHLGQCCIEGF